MAKKVTIDDLDVAIDAILKEYKEDVDKNLHETAVDVGNVGVQALKNAAKSTFETHNSKKPYWRGWKASDESTRMTTSVVLYNSTVPGLPHLLENGHAKRGGGRVEGRAHIKPVEDKINKLFEKKLKVIL